MHMRCAKWNRVLALLLSLILMISLPACGKPETQEAVAPVVSVAPTAAPDEAEAEDEPERAPSETDDSTYFESNDGLVTEFHAIQVMAKGLDTDTGAFFDMSHFVAGKSTMLRVAFESEVDIEQDGSMYINIYRDGEEVTQLLPLNQGEHEETYFMPRHMKDVDNWAAGKYELEFVYGESTATRTLTMREAQKIKVLAVPVLANYGGQVVACEGEWKTGIQLTRDAYPLADDGIEYVLGNELDLSDDMYDLLTDEGQYNVWDALCGLQTPNDDYRLILGFVRERQGEDRTLQGYTYGKPANVITESDGDMEPTVSHEIAHCYYVGDEYPGGSLNPKVNTPPYGMEGNDFNDRDIAVVGAKKANIAAWEYGNENSGSLIYPEQMAFNVAQWKKFNRVGSFMGSGSDDVNDYWVTSDIWTQLFKAFALGGVADERASSKSAPACPNCCEELDVETFGLYGHCTECGSYTQISADDSSFACGDCGAENQLDSNTILLVCPECGEESLLSQMTGKKDSKEASALGIGAAQAEPEELRVLDIAGTVYASGSFKVKPWYAYEGLSSDVTVKRSGAYAVVMEDANGKAISTQYFDVSFYNIDQPDKKDYAPVNITVRYPENVSTIKIMQDTKTLYSASVSANAPKISFANIKKNQQLSSKTEVKWSGADADGDTLYYELWYCPNEDEFINLASNITQTSCTVDFDALPGTEEGYFYLYATDGINTSELASERIRSEYMAPEIISTQATVPSYKLTDEIVLDADVYDSQDGWLYEEGVNWTLNGREYMSGSLLWVYPYELTPGEHVFTLTAANSKGKTASKEFKFRIIDDESALPNDWSREDIKLALTNGFIAPLRNVNAAITRGQFAALMANLYWTLWGAELPMPEFDYEEGVVKDCGEDDYDQFLMVKLGVMEAPGGKFNPNGNLTEEEAMTIIYKVCAFSLPEEDHSNDSIKTIVDECLETGVMTQSGDNAYNASAKITGRLALVRCNRLYQFLFGDA